jgi:LysR family carnitine catabolism transcriptional activator
VAQSLSFAVACERLHLSQSALSLTIKALEESLGGRVHPQYAQCRADRRG